MTPRKTKSNMRTTVIVAVGLVLAGCGAPSNHGLTPKPLLDEDADAGVRRTVSIGGIYRAHTFHAWARRESIRGIVRFDVDDPREVVARLLLPNIRDVVVPHIAYAGTGDDWDDRYAALAAARAREFGAPVEHVGVPGDHMSSVRAAVADFLQRLRADGPECAPGG